MVYKIDMNKIYLTLLPLALVTTPVYSHDTCSTEQRVEETNGSERIRARKVEVFPSNSRRSRSLEDYINRNPPAPRYCETKKITDEYGYVHYFQTCR